MTSFALITEGITDQAIIENILDCLTDGNAVTKSLRPLRDETDRNRVAKNEFSNWELVLEFIKSDEILDAIQTSNFVVIQIDTDQCEHVNFGISLLNAGIYKPIEELVNECIRKIKTLLHPDFPDTELKRLLFAIPVLSSECWLVSLHDGSHTHTNKTSISCDIRLAGLLKIKKIAYCKEYEVYAKLSKDFRKRKKLSLAASKTPCLQIFVDQVIAGTSTDV